MKQALLVAILKILFLTCISGQSKKMEFVPDFNEVNSTYITSPVQFTAPEEAIEFIGLSCYHFGGEELDIYYRLKTDGLWSEWIQFQRQYEFVESSRSAYRTKPIPLVFSDIEFKTTKKLKSPLTVRVFLAELNKQELQPIKKSFDCDKPEVCERVCWCPTCPVDNTPEFTEPTHLIVHHSAGNNQSNNFATVVEFIWDLHVNTNGWDDIGYNWLIDPNGIVYEGRPDGYQGAHFSCLNENTVGICVIGDYSTVEPSDAALNTLVNLLAYEATEHRIDIEAQSYHDTGDFLLENLAGHRDSSGSVHACSATVCPGNSFYPLLEDLRQQVSDLPCYDNVSSSTLDHGNSDLNFFPNPIKDHLYLEYKHDKSQELEIIDLTGKSLGYVKSGQTNNLSHLNSGIYFIVLNGETLGKFVKE